MIPTGVVCSLRRYGEAAEDGTAGLQRGTLAERFERSLKWLHIAPNIPIGDVIYIKRRASEIGGLLRDVFGNRAPPSGEQHHYCTKQVGRPLAEKVSRYNEL